MRLLMLLLLLYAVPARAEILPGPDDLFLPPHGDEGCWVSFFDGSNFTARSAQLRGRSYVESFRTQTEGAVKPTLDHVGGEAFFKQVESLVVGPHARLVAYRQPNFRDHALTLGPGRKVADLSAIDFHAQVRSFKIFCEAT